MTSNLHIAQISDIHISEDENDFQNIPVRDNFLQTLEAVVGQNPDLVVLSGDLAADHGETGAYKWLAEVVKKCKIPMVIMPGNHDDLNSLNIHLNLTPELNNGEYFFKKSFKGLPLLFLDTSTNNLSSTQLDWLENESRQNNGTEFLVFIHHPPLDCNCLFMDSKYPLLNREKAWSVLANLGNINHIFCGHYHIDKIVQKDNKKIYLCPSTMMQLSGTNIEFEIESRVPAWRSIIWNGREIKTETFSL